MITDDAVVKFVELAVEFLKAEDATKHSAAMKFIPCGKDFSRTSATNVCGKEKNWHSYCKECQATLLQLQILKNDNRRVKLDARNKALKALHTYWKENCNGKR